MSADVPMGPFDGEVRDAVVLENIPSPRRMLGILPLEVAVARVCHEANRAYCHALGDDSQVPWDEAPEWQRTSAINGVRYHLEHPNSTPADSHGSWMREKREAGWVYGPEKDEMLRTHLCMVPYEDLPAEQRAKDALFLSIVRALDPIKWIPVRPNSPGWMVDREGNVIVIFSDGKVWCYAQRHTPPRWEEMPPVPGTPAALVIT